jgi:hypothetical protein
MTRQRDFKALVRERMAKTGERYTTARAHVLAKLARGADSTSVFPGILDGYDSFGGVQSGTSAIHNVLRYVGLNSPLGAPPTEAAINGLCGGPGFLYAVFEYKGWPPMLTLALSNRSMPDVYAEQGLSRLGVKLAKHETTGRATAQKTLDEALSDGHAPLCVTDAASLRYMDLPREFVGGAPHVVAVVGRDGDSYWIDDRQAQPIRVEGPDLAAARAAYRHAKNRLFIVGRPETDPTRRNAMDAVADALRDTARRYVDPAVPKSFAGNCGFAGLEKWRAALTDAKDRRGWPTIFREGARAYAALHRAYEDIECRVSGAGRTFYAEFLDALADLPGHSRLREAAEAYRESGESWSRIASLIATCPDRAVRAACNIADQRVELADAAASGASGEAVSLWQKRQKLAEECRLDASTARELYSEIATLVGNIIDAERRAVPALA